MYGTTNIKCFMVLLQIFCIHTLAFNCSMCDVTYIELYNTYLHGTCFLSALYNDISFLISPQSTLCLYLVTQVHKRMPLLEAVHYAQTNVTLLTEIQRAPICFCS